MKCPNCNHSMNKGGWRKHFPKVKDFLGQENDQIQETTEAVIWHCRHCFKIIALPPSSSPVPRSTIPRPRTIAERLIVVPERSYALSPIK